MPDIILFGATGYTGRLTARALMDRGASFGIAGRNSAKLDSLGREVGRPPSYVAEAGDTLSLVRALEDAKVLISCVGPFARFGATAVEAALQAGVHYIDSTGEGSFVATLLERDEEARAAGITMAPAMGFDEVPGDLAATLAAQDLPDPSLKLTYALPRSGSTGTRRSAFGIMTSRAPWIRDGRSTQIRAGETDRWAPLPDPLGPKLAVSFPLALCHLAPRHLEMQGFETYITTGGAERRMMRLGLPILEKLETFQNGRVLDRIAGDAGEGPGPEARASSRWTILAEASSSNGGWRNVVVTGTDPYGLTAHLLAAGACRMSGEGYDLSGVLSPVQAMGRDRLREELEDQATVIDIYAPA